MQTSAIVLRNASPVLVPGLSTVTKKTRKLDFVPGTSASGLHNMHCLAGFAQPENVSERPQSGIVSCARVAAKEEELITSTQFIVKRPLIDVEHDASQVHNSRGSSDQRHRGDLYLSYRKVPSEK